MWAVVARHQAQTGLAAAVFLPGGSKGPCAVAAGQDGSLWGIDIATGAAALMPVAAPKAQAAAAALQ